jgi:hypothetical protein
MARWGKRTGKIVWAMKRLYLWRQPGDDVKSLCEGFHKLNKSMYSYMQPSDRLELLSIGVCCEIFFLKTEGDGALD